MNVETPFPIWLKQRRKALDLRQEDLAERIGCSESTIRKFELGERRPSRQMAELLAEQLHIPPEERPDFINFARGQDSVSEQGSAVAANLPTSLTPLIGREKEVEEASSFLIHKGVRLLTLTGPPGIGKTRLSLEAGAALLDHFEDGVFFVNLAAVSNPDLVAAAIAHTLSVTDKSAESLVESLQCSLGGKELLLVLDNFEQVLDASSVVLELLGACPNLKVMITSREALHVNGEQQFPVPSLTTPDPAKLPSLQYLESIPAVALFTERAHAVKPDFVLTEENAKAVAAICTRLDGLPLAIELAAARVRLFSPQEIEARLDSRLSVLAGGPRNLPPRQRTLRAAIDWSYNLLNKGEQTLFTRMGVFTGGCTLSGAEVMCNAVGDLQFDMQEGIESLLDKNLLKRGEGGDGESRFTMLELIREYALERLRASGEEEAIRDTYASYFLTLAETTAAHARGPDEHYWVQRLENDHDNIRAVLRSLIVMGRAEEATRLCGALWVFWSKCDHISEGRTWMEQVLALARSSRYVSPLTLAGALVCAGRLARSQSDLHEARTLQEEALAIYRQEGDRHGESFALNSLALIESGLHNYEQAQVLHEQNLALRRELCDRKGLSATLNNLGLLWLELNPERGRLLLEESLALSRELGIQDGVAPTLLNLGIAAYKQSRFADAHSYFEEGLALHRHLKNTRGVQIALMRLGLLALDEADLGAARDHFSRSLEYSRKLVDKEISVWNFEGLAYVVAADGLHEWAATLMGASEGLSEAIGAPISTESPTHERTLEAIRSALDPAQLAAAWAYGKAMDLEQAIEYALEIG